MMNRRFAVLLSLVFLIGGVGSLAAQSRKNGILFPSTDPAFTDKWYFTRSEMGPRVSPQAQVYAGQKLSLYLIMLDYAVTSKGKVDLTYSIEISGPAYDNPVLKEGLVVRKAPGIKKGQVLLSEQNLSMAFRPQDPPGMYTFTVNIKDGVARDVYTAVTRIELKDFNSRRNVFTNRDQLDSWFVAYYTQPDPTLFIDAFEFLFSQNLTKEETIIPPYMGFFKRIVEVNPQLLPLAVERFKQSDRNLGYYYMYLFSILGDSGPKNFRMGLQGEMLEQWEKLNSSVKPSLLHPTSPADSDFLWGHFFASGERRFLIPLLEVLKDENADTRIKDSVMISLTENYRLHSLVSDYLQFIVSYDTEYSDAVQNLILGK